MSKKTLVMLLLYCTCLNARESRTPLSLYNHPRRYLYPPAYDPQRPWLIDVWVAAFFRKADKAFCSDRKRCSLSTLNFTREDFTGADTLAPAVTAPALQQDGTTRRISSSPFLPISILSPRTRYTDRGFFLGGSAGKYIREK